METTTPVSGEIPTALPGFEDDDAREKLLLADSTDELEDAAEEESIDLEEQPAKQPKRRWQILKTVAGFAIFVCILVIGVAWFFGIGWFSRPQTQAVNRSGQRDTQASPATEDEKLKMALSMIAPPPAGSPGESNLRLDSDDDARSAGNPSSETENSGISTLTSIDQNKKTQIGERESYPLPQAAKPPSDNVTLPNSSQVVEAGNEPRAPSRSKVGEPDDARGRSLFFGLSKKPAKEDELLKPEIAQVARAELPETVLPAQIPFGTLLPVRLVGSIYTLRNSGGFVRMELTRPMEGKGYSYPAGTMIVGNVRSGEAVRAFVNIVGLIDPVSGELVRFSGELLGRDGGSGIEGKRRNLTSQWSRFFRGMKDTAASVLGSVGALRSGSTVVLSEPMRRGTESMTEDLSGAILKNDRESTFLEVAAGSNGYVLVTGLPENSAAATNKLTPEAGKK